VNPVAGHAAIGAGHLQHQFAVGARGVGDGVGAGRNVGARVAQRHVLAGPVTDGLTHRAQAQLHHPLGDAALVGDDEEGVLPGRKELGPGILGAPLDAQFVGDRLGHAHQAIALAPLFLGQGHVEHHALVELTGGDLDLAFAAGAGTAVVGQGVAGLLEGHQYGVAIGAVHRLARGLHDDAGH
jgi:hypothetical protein